MALQETPHEELFSLLAHRRRHIVQGMIRITEPAKPSSNSRPSPSSSLGDLDDLPLELLLAIFALLDFRTLSHISRTCLRGIKVVKSLPEYRDLMLHAPDALAALGKTRLIRCHPVANLHLTLLSSDCVSCGRYGAFLFLPTCERCCYHCLWQNQILWLIPIAMAKKCFGISAAGAKTLLFMRSVPGKYWVRSMTSRQRPIRLVCVRHAKKLALAENRSEEIMRQDLEQKRSAGLSSKEYWFFRYLQQSSVTPDYPEFLGQPTESDVPDDIYCGMASLPLPFLAPDNRVEHGFWCQGCELVWRQWSPNNQPPEHLAHLVLPGCRADDVVYNTQEVARSKSEFLTHIDECPGAKEMFRMSR